MPAMLLAALLSATSVAEPPAQRPRVTAVARARIVAGRRVIVGAPLRDRRVRRGIIELE